MCGSGMWALEKFLSRYMRASIGAQQYAIHESPSEIHHVVTRSEMLIFDYAFKHMRRIYDLLNSSQSTKLNLYVFKQRNT